MSRVFVAMSGGVDSSVAAALLQRAGHQVTGVFMKNWSDTPDACTGDCGWTRERQDALRVAAHLGLPFETYDFEAEYRQGVVDYLVREYAAGRTPNPDVMCNRLVKFDLFLKRALAAGADLIATGHYARINRRPTDDRHSADRHADNRHSRDLSPGAASGRQPRSHHAEGEGMNPAVSGEWLPAGCLSPETYQLLVGVDCNKDQSYFLHRLDQFQLAHTLFPVGSLPKSEVRYLAREFGLPTAEKKDSQGICFIGKVDLADFLKDRIAQRPGPIVTPDGHEVGEHDGLAPYTIGQRHGMSLGGGDPYYVVAKDVASNTLVVSRDEQNLLAQALFATDAHWISGEPPTLPWHGQARLRYRQPLQRCTITTSTGGLHVSFAEPQRAISPGQFVVFYDGDRCLGGAVIDRAESDSPHL